MNKFKQEVSSAPQTQSDLIFPTNFLHKAAAEEEDQFLTGPPARAVMLLVFGVHLRPGRLHEGGSSGFTGLVREASGRGGGFAAWFLSGSGAEPQ